MTPENAIESQMRRSYAATAYSYRLDDETQVLTNDHRDVCRSLREICLSFGRPISVLEVGCGTGRLFHCLASVDKLVGMDLSPEMLDLARTPVRAANVNAREIELRCQSMNEASFPATSFDFIYAIGVFGHGCVLAPSLCQRFHEWLKKDGKLFFDTFDPEGFPRKIRLRQTARAVVYPLLPRSARHLLDKRAALPFFAPTSKELSRLVYAAGFVQAQIESRIRDMPCGRGRKLQCLATK